MSPEDVFNELAFALIGLYLHVECDRTGREVQLAHVELARKKREWPAFTLPECRGAITGLAVLAAEAGPERDRMIDEWCRDVWNAFAGSHETVRGLTRQLPIGNLKP